MLGSVRQTIRRADDVVWSFVRAKDEVFVAASMMSFGFGTGVYFGSPALDMPYLGLVMPTPDSAMAAEFVADMMLLLSVGLMFWVVTAHYVQDDG